MSCSFNTKLPGLFLTGSLKASKIPESASGIKIMLAQVCSITEDYEESLGWLKMGLKEITSLERKKELVDFKIFSGLMQFQEFKTIRNQIDEALKSRRVVEGEDELPM